MLGKSLRATGSRNSMNGIRTKGRNGIKRSRSPVVRRSWIVSPRQAIAQGINTYLSSFSPGQGGALQHLVLQLGTDLDFLSEKFCSMPIMRCFLFDGRPRPRDHGSFGLVFLLCKFLLDLLSGDIDNFGRDGIDRQRRRGRAGTGRWSLFDHRVFVRRCACLRGLRHRWWRRWVCRALRIGVEIPQPRSSGRESGEGKYGA